MYDNYKMTVMGIIYIEFTSRVQSQKVRLLDSIRFDSIVEPYQVESRAFKDLLESNSS